MSEPATTCPDCGRLTARYATWLDDFDGVCAGATQASDALLNCRKVTIANLRAQLADAHEVSLELCRWETWAVMQLSVDSDLHGEAMRAAATAKLAEATKLREAVDAVEAVYQTPESDAHDVVSEYEQHVRALLRAEAKNG